MPSRKRCFDNVPTEEERAPKDQDSHAIESRVEGAA